MKSIKLLVLFIFAVLLLSNVSYSQSIPGGTGRYEALGSNPFMLDPVMDINNNPAWSTAYKNYVFGDIGRGKNPTGSTDPLFELTGQYAGINFKVSKDMNLGLVLNKREDKWDQFNNYGTSGCSSPIVPLKVLFGYATPNFALGFAPYYSAWSQSSDSTQGTETQNLSWKSSSLGATLGMIYKMNQNWFEGAVDFKMNSYKYEGTYTGTLGSSSYLNENEGGMQLAVNLRGWFLANKPNKVAIVPYLGFGVYSWNPKITTSPAAFTTVLPKYSEMNINGGIGVNMPVLENGMLATGLSAGFYQYKSEISDATNYIGKYTAFTLPKFNIGLEWKFVDWLSGRFGYSRSIISTGTKETGNNTTVTPAIAYTIENKISQASDPVQTINLGIGLHFDRFSLDGTIGERLLKNGPFIITNNVDNNDFYGVFSASYNFNR